MGKSSSYVNFKKTQVHLSEEECLLCKSEDLSSGSYERYDGNGKLTICGTMGYAKTVWSPVELRCGTPMKP